MKVAILPWGNVFEDYLDTIGVSVHQFATEMDGGWLFGYTEALRLAGVQSCIVIVSRDASSPYAIVNPDTGITTHVLPSPKSFRWLNRFAATKRFAPYFALPQRALTETLQRDLCTHIVMQEYADPRFDRLAPLAHRLGLPIIPTFQGGRIEPHFFFARWMRRKAMRLAAGLIIASSNEEQRVRHVHGEDFRIARIFNPIDARIWFPEERHSCREALGYPFEAKIAICHCRISIRHKGLDVLLSAWRQIMRRHPSRELRLHLIGDGPDSPALRAEIARKPVPGLHWIDNFSHDRSAMRRELSAADVHVQASRHEGFSVAPLEAMACGLPTVLSRAPGAADLLPDGESSGGILVPVEDSDALADALERLLLDDARRAEVGRLAAVRVHESASIEAVGQQLVEFLSGGKRSA